MKWITANLLTSSLAFGVPYYKLPTSPIPSGEENIEHLRAKTKEGKLTYWLQVQLHRPKRKLWLHQANFVQGIHLSRKVLAKKNSTARPFPKWSALSQRKLIQGEHLDVLGHEGEWLKIKAKPNFYIHSSEVNEIDHDKGRLITRKAVALKSQPNHKAKTLGWAPKLKNYNIVGFTKEWVQISTKYGTAYIPIESSISKIDFAAKILNHKNQWLPVRSSIAGAFLTEDNQWFDIDNIKALKLNTNLGIILEPTATFSKSNKSYSFNHSIPSFAKVDITGLKDEFWGKAKLKGHGWVWWAEPKNTLENTLPVKLRQEVPKLLSQKKKHYILKQMKQKKPKTIDSKALFKRRIFDMAASPILPELRFISAEGIFWTLDGKFWSQVEQFKKQDHPIAFSPEGRLYIGNFFSDDHGQTFTPYIRWEKVMQALGNHSEKHKGLRLTRIDILDKVGKNIQLKLEVNNKEQIINSDNHGKTWRLSKSDQSAPLL